MSPETDKISALQIVEEVRAATTAAKCHQCGCFHSALKVLGQARRIAAAEMLLGEARCLM